MWAQPVLGKSSLAHVEKGAKTEQRDRDGSGWQSRLEGPGRDASGRNRSSSTTDPVEPAEIRSHPLWRVGQESIRGAQKNRENKKLYKKVNEIRKPYTAQL